MDAEALTEIAALLKTRLQGEFDWLFEQMIVLLAARGGENDQGTLRIGFNPRYGSGYAACIFHAPIVTLPGGIHIPNSYKRILKRFNGAKLHATDLFGFPEDESNQRRCVSLTHANTYWIRGYKRLPKDWFYFGSRFFDDAVNVGYFADATGTVFAAKKSGEVVDQWPSVEQMLFKEFEIA